MSLGGASDIGPQEVPRMITNIRGRHSKNSQALQPVAGVQGLDALRQKLDDMNILQLLTYYRYHVAPWTDQLISWTCVTNGKPLALWPPDSPCSPTGCAIHWFRSHCRYR